MHSLYLWFNTALEVKICTGLNFRNEMKVTLYFAKFLRCFMSFRSVKVHVDRKGNIYDADNLQKKFSAQLWSWETNFYTAHIKHTTNLQNNSFLPQFCWEVPRTLHPDRLISTQLESKRIFNQFKQVNSLWFFNKLILSVNKPMQKIIWASEHEKIRIKE